MKKSIVAGVGVVLLISVAILWSLNRPSPIPNQPAPPPASRTPVAVATPLSAAIAPEASVATNHDVAAINPYAGSLKVPGKAKRRWDVAFMRAHQNAAAGEAIEFELTEGRQAIGTVRITQYRNGELSYISGELTAPEAGKFFFFTPPELGVAGRAVGVVEFPESKTAYRVEPTGVAGAPELWERRLDEVICMPLPKPSEPLAVNAQTNGEPVEITPLRPDEVASTFTSYNSNIVSLQSYPGAKAVLLLDFAGGYTPTWGGVYFARPTAANDSTIRDVWKRVAEDYMPFNINVTTDIKVYLDAPATSRQRVAFTTTPVTAAGVAYYGSWNWGSDTPCWSVYITGKSSAEVASHEAGHTLGLSHQGQWDGTTTTNEYYGGHGSGETGWAPIMGVGYYQPEAQWAKGEYNAANQFEDELNRITTANNNVTYRPDDTGDTLATARYLEINPDYSISGEGVIERTSDSDAFQFTTAGGTVSLTARPVGDWANLAMAVTIANSADTVIHSNNPQSTVWAGIKTNLAAGTYTFRVLGVGKNNPLNTGFTAYGSLGYYSLVGFVTGGRLPTRLNVFESVANGTTVGTVPPAVPGNLAYAIVAGNSSGTFAIDTNGVLTVANNAALVYSRLATNSSYFTGLELLVNITNLDTSGLDELNRRVVVNVLSTNANYPLTVTGYNAGLIVPYNATVALPKATGFDMPNNWTFYQEGLNGNAQISASGNGLQGFPADRLLRSQVDGSTFEVGPYGATNALMMGNGFPASSTLVLTTPQPLNKLAILASSANGGGNGTLVLNFSDGTKSPTFNFNAQDWYNTTTNVAFQGYGRVRLGQATFSTENPGWNNPNIYQTTLDLAALGINKTVNSITFTGPPVAGTRTTAILGLSGQAMPAAVAITRQPTSLTNNIATATATFSVAAMGTPPLGYQWYRGTPGSGTLMVGQTATNLTLSGIQPADAGSYYVVVTNSTSSATSAAATLTVYRAPQIVQQPTPAQSRRSLGGSISYTVAATAALPVSYYWLSNSVFIPGATGATLSLANLQLGHSATYSVIVSNAFGTATSSSAALTVVTTNYPYAQLVLADFPMGYWRLDELSGTTAYDCANGRNGTYTNTQLGQAGYNLVDTHKAARFGSLAPADSFVRGIPIDFGSSANQSFTVEAWVNGGTQTSDAGLITKGTGGGGEQFNLDCGGGSHAFRFFVRKDDGGAVLASGNVLPGNQWRHVVGVLNRSAGYVALYVNGVSNASGTFPTENYRGVLRSTNAVSIGSRQSANTTYNNQFLGLMQDVAIYNYALSPAQILAHYSAASNRPPVFLTNPLTKPNANAGQAYAAAVNTDVTEPNGDTVIFSKVSGPGWLNVGSTGALFGTPAESDANTNAFVVSARDTAGLSNVATLNIYVNASPAFNVNPLLLPDVLAGQALSVNIATHVSDPNPLDVFSFSKVSGPDWVLVAGNGTIAGTPGTGDVGTNSVVVAATDPGSLTANATVLIRVLSPAAPLQASLAPQGSDLLLSWTGGLAPYQVEMSTNLTGTNWIPVGTATSATSLLITPSNAATFYRILGN